MSEHHRKKHWRYRFHPRYYPPWWYPEVNIPPPPHDPYYDYPDRVPFRYPRVTSEEELKMLEEEEMMLQDEIEAIRKRKKELEKEVK